MDYFNLSIIFLILAVVFVVLRDKNFSVMEMKPCGCSAMKRGYPCPYAPTKGGCPYRNCPRMQ